MVKVLKQIWEAEKDAAALIELLEGVDKNLTKTSNTRGDERARRLCGYFAQN